MRSDIEPSHRQQVVAVSSFLLMCMWYLGYWGEKGRRTIPVCQSALPVAQGAEWPSLLRPAGQTLALELIILLAPGCAAVLHLQGQLMHLVHWDLS